MRSRGKENEWRVCFDLDDEHFGKLDKFKARESGTAGGEPMRSLRSPSNGDSYRKASFS